ncbi:ABC transporter ATP-binding protein [Prauserella marina]|uniref:ABC transporter n=1 Tax=Prauserella marina TaxID=530584 RepID=A0A222VTD3_9PSEU|nr:ATP-binding cassette domain-containing protein [Prauserella marina]ASR37169.1 ABC transporter ATP-binding protein [Prauserella marina]PWV72479.1 ABC transporter family protein [Prauserella marina]SDD79081.1 ABC transporter [Prauserella marina]
MQVVANRVSVAGPRGTALPSTSLTITTGELIVVNGESGTGCTAFGLALTGALRPDTGEVTVDGAADLARLRRHSALVDAPRVSAPEGQLPVHDVVADELAFADLPSDQTAVSRLLAGHDLSRHAETRIDDLPAESRTRLLTDLAALRPDVRMLVLDRPDRHTGDVEGWPMLAHEHAERGLAVVVLTATVSVSSLFLPVARLGELDQPAAQRCAPEVPV